MTELLPHFKQDLDSVVLVPSKGGRFEVEFNGKLLYSKLETGTFPDTAQLIRTLEADVNR